ncbi:MAG TPA: hypothetical protein VGP17_12740 [Solirubrobacteraceae bacterium]|jgi:hypothetical protein|nr:hypothetical protein [Solirubrobacteraceae bacterium]
MGARTLVTVALAAAWLPGLAWPPSAAAQASWSFAAAEAPPAPAGVAPAPYGVPVGTVGEISFWAPNRGVLITGGTEAAGGPVSAGVYAYDGVSWHQLATECGSAEGRVVWAGPDEFWTISDQRAGQLVAGSGEQIEAPAVSLCRFVSGVVAASYAMPLEEPESWVHMNGGACYGPNDCWFGGGDGRPPHIGAFHLHWNGSTMTAVYEPEDHSVSSMADFEGTIYEAVQLKSDDAWLEYEQEFPAVIHTIAPEGEDPFSDLAIYSESAKHDLPIYGEGKKVQPEALQGFDLVANAPAGEAASQLWAAANPSQEPPASSELASLTVVRDMGGAWTQILPVNTSGGEPAALAGQLLAGSAAQVGRSSEAGTAEAIAPEPGGEDAWLSLTGGSKVARLALLEADGKVARTEALPIPTEGVGFHGSSGPIICPAAHDCWMATDEGWLFHLSEGMPEAPDKDPMFDGEDGVIKSRPGDGGQATVYVKGEAAEDDSLANQQVIRVEAESSKPQAKHVRKSKPRKLVKHVKSRLLDHRTLVISFMLTAKAHVQLIARRESAVVAQTPRESLRPGAHTLSLTLSPERWPTKLQFEAKPANQHHASSTTGSGESPGSENVVGT